MTDNEIKDLASQYVKATIDPQYKSPDLSLEIRAREREITSFLSFLTDRFCLVEKSKVKERYDEAMLQSLSYSRIDIVSGNCRKVLLESLFGKELFNEQSNEK